MMSVKQFYNDPSKNIAQSTWNLGRRDLKTLVTSLPHFEKFVKLMYF